MVVYDLSTLSGSVHEAPGNHAHRNMVSAMTIQQTHTQPYAPIVIPMSSDNIHFLLLSANTINTNLMRRGPGQEDDSLQSGP